MALENDYEVLERLGEGSFGKVYKARHRKTGSLVAVKQIKLGAKSWDEALKSTELQVLRKLRHPFVVRLRELLRSPNDGSLYYIFEFVCSDLSRFMRKYASGLEEARAAELTRQLLAGVAHMHQHGFFHRDIKPENVLLEEHSFTIRLADFGEARNVRARPPFTDYVGTRWYRAPECLLRDRAYSSPVDIWASGLVFAELLRGTAVFMGTSSIDQLYKIFQVLGQPHTGDWPELVRLAEVARFRLPQQSGCGLKRVLPESVTPQVHDLLAEILALNPRRRPLARKCIEHAAFAELQPLEIERSESTFSAPPQEEPGGASAPITRCSTASELGPGATPRSARSPRAKLEGETPAPPLLAKAAKGGSVMDSLDFDAELDKILASGSPMEDADAESDGDALPPQKEVATVAGVGIGGRAAPAVSGAGPFGASIGLGGSSLGISGFSFAPSLRQQAPCSSPPAAAPAAHTDLTNGAAQKNSPDRSVDALLDSLCADLGFSPEAGPPAAATSAPPAAPAAASPLTLRLSTDLGVSPDSRASAPVPAFGPAGAAAARGTGGYPSLGISGATGISGLSPASSSKRTDDGVPEAVAEEERLRGAEPSSITLAADLCLGLSPVFAAGEHGRSPGNAGFAAAEGTRADRVKEAHGVIATSEEGFLSPSLPVPGQQRNRADDEALKACLGGIVQAAPGGVSASQGGGGSLPPGGVDRDPSGTTTSNGSARPAREAELLDAASQSLQEAPATADDSTHAAPVAAVGTLPPQAALTSYRGAYDGDEDEEEHRASGNDSSACGAEAPPAKAMPSAKPWEPEEATRLRKLVKRVSARGVVDKDALWSQVGAEMGNGRTAKECKKQYARDYRAHKAATATKQRSASPCGESLA